MRYNDSIVWILPNPLSEDKYQGSKQSSASFWYSCTTVFTMCMSGTVYVFMPFDGPLLEIDTDIFIWRLVGDIKSVNKIVWLDSNWLLANTFLLENPDIIGRVW